MRSEEDEKETVPASFYDGWPGDRCLCPPVWIVTDSVLMVTNVFNHCHVKKNVRGKDFPVGSQ